MVFDGRAASTDEYNDEENYQDEDGAHGGGG